MRSFKQFIKEAFTPGTVFNFGATAYGNADIDETTAMEIKNKVLKPEWQYLGTRNNKLTPGYSIANNKLPFGTIVKITDRRTNQPVGAPFGNVNGIYKVEDKGGGQVYNNIDFYSGSDRNMYNYYAKYGTNSNVLNVEVLNIKPGSPEEQQIIANLKSGGSNLPPQPEEDYYETPADAAMGLAKGVETFAKSMNPTLGIVDRITGGGVK